MTLTKEIRHKEMRLRHGNLINDKDLNNLGANVRYQKQKVTMWVLVVHLYFASDLGPSLTLLLSAILSLVTANVSKLFPDIKEQHSQRAG